jgi:hypothetical protein
LTRVQRIGCAVLGGAAAVAAALLVAFPLTAQTTSLTCSGGLATAHASHCLPGATATVATTSAESRPELLILALLGLAVVLGTTAWMPGRLQLGLGGVTGSVLPATDSLAAEIRAVKQAVDSLGAELDALAPHAPPDAKPVPPGAPPTEGVAGALPSEPEQLREERKRQLAAADQHHAAYESLRKGLR